MDYTEKRIENVVIEGVMLGFEDHNIMTCMVHVKGNERNQGFGGYPLGKYDKLLERQVGTAYGMEWLMRLMNAIGAREFKEMKGMYVRIEADEYKIFQIGHIVKEQWFNPEEMKHFKEPVYEPK